MIPVSLFVWLGWRVRQWRNNRRRPDRDLMYDCDRGSHEKKS